MTRVGERGLALNDEGKRPAGPSRPCERATGERVVRGVARLAPALLVGEPEEGQCLSVVRITRDALFEPSHVADGVAAREPREQTGERVLLWPTRSRERERIADRIDRPRRREDPAEEQESGGDPGRAQPQRCPSPHRRPFARGGSAVRRTERRPRPNKWRRTGTRRRRKGEGMSTGRLVQKRTLLLVALLGAIAALVAAALVSKGAAPSTARAADHLDAPGLTPPPGGDGIGTDLTDIYACQSPADASKTVLTMNVNGLLASDLAHPPGADRPFGTKVPQVHGNPNVSYNFRIDAK